MSKIMLPVDEKLYKEVKEKLSISRDKALSDSDFLDEIVKEIKEKIK